MINLRDCIGPDGLPICLVSMFIEMKDNPPNHKTEEVIWLQTGEVFIYVAPKSSSNNTNSR